MTEIEKTKKQIEVLTKKLSFLEELSQTKTPCEEAYKKVFGYFPTEPNWDDDEVRWESFQKGYNAAQKDYKVGKYQESEKEPEELMEKLGFVKNSDGNWTAQPLVETAQEPIPEEDNKTLYDILRELDKPMFIDDVCSAVKKWMFQYDCDYATCEDYLEGYTECQTVLEERLK